MTEPEQPLKDDIWFYWKGLLDERVRSYVVVAVTALIVIFVAQLMTGSLIAAGVPLICGLTAIGLRWSIMPGFCVASVAYFQLLPFGIPIGGLFVTDPQYTHFRLQDLMLVAAVTIYLIAQYRVYSLIHLAVPDERLLRGKRKKSRPDLRDPAQIEESEIPVMLITAAGVLLAGQLAWLFLSEVVLDFRQFPLLRLRETFGRTRGPGVSPAASRWMMFVLGTGTLLFLTRLALWYWRLRTLNRQEAQLLLLDTGWTEMRREAARQETWRNYGKLRSRPVPVRPKPKKRPPPRNPWLGAAILRSCLIIAVAILLAVVLVCSGVWLIDRYNRF